MCGWRKRGLEAVRVMQEKEEKEQAMSTDESTNLLSKFESEGIKMWISDN